MEYKGLTYEELKHAAYMRLGYKCKICGFADPRALQIDHVQGFPNRPVNTREVYIDIITMDDSTLKYNYQILCANCNWIKRSNEEEYGTKREFEGYGAATCPFCGFVWYFRARIPERCPSCRKLLPRVNKKKENMLEVDYLIRN